MAAALVHSWIQVNLCYKFPEREKYYLFSELSLLIDGKEYKPDVCVYPHEKVSWRPEILRMEVLPLTAIEILSPTQPYLDLLEKKDVYLNAGVQSVWIVNPFQKAVTLLYQGQEQNFAKADVVTDKKLDITLPLNDIFP